MQEANPGGCWSIAHRPKWRIYANAVPLISTVASLGLLAMPLSAQQYPGKPVRILVGFAPGGGIDISARVLASTLNAPLGQPVIVDNRPGAGSNIAAELVARAAPDGYTLLMGSIAALAINPSLYGNLPFDPVKDFVPIAQTGSMSNIIVTHTALPVRNLKEFVALAKRQPGQIACATPGAGSSAHLAAELLRRRAGIDIAVIPYKGGGQAVVDVLSGQLPVLFGAVPVVMAHVQAGKFRAIAVTTVRRSPAMPDVPTVAEAAYPGYAVDNWYGLVAPAGTPRSITERLNSAVTGALRSPEVAKRFRDAGHEAVPSTAQEFGVLIKSEMARWSKVIAQAGIKAQ